MADKGELGPTLSRATLSAIVAVGVTIWALTLRSDLDGTREELDATTQELASTKQELDKTKPKQTK